MQMKRVWASVPDSVEQELKRIAQEQGRSQADLVAFILEDWINRKREQEKNESLNKNP